MPKTCKHESCNNFVFGGGYCKYHQSFRTDKKPSKPKQAGRIRPVSKKQAALNRQYMDARDEYMSEHPLCQAKLPDCTHIATDLHHKRGRGKYLLDKSTYLALCRNCHSWIETHPAEAKELNFSESRLNI